jgi:hypothetical protein
MKYKRRFNGYLGFEPVSLFVELEGTYPMDKAYNFYSKIVNYETKDIIFEGDIIKNIAFLSWITPNLINDEHFVSVVLTVKELWTFGTQIDVTAQRIIVIVDKLFSGWARVLDTMGQSDLVLVKTGNPHTLDLVKEEMTEHNCQSSLYFDSVLLDKHEVLKLNITTAYPYGRE